jgi:hypothetical protein
MTKEEIQQKAQRTQQEIMHGLNSIEQLKVQVAIARGKLHVYTELLQGLEASGEADAKGEEEK